MSEDEGRITHVGVRPIVVQGITLRPGDPVLVRHSDGQWVKRIYEGWVDGGGAWMEFDELSTHKHNDPGPYPLEDLKHPDLLTGFVRTVDESG